MNDTITLRGKVATTPRTITTTEGLTITSFRLATTQRRLVDGEWVDTNTNWYTITCFRGLAKAAVRVVNKGDDLIVLGTVKVRDWEAGEKSGTTIEIEAETFGHDVEAIERKTR